MFPSSTNRAVTVVLALGLFGCRTKPAGNLSGYTCNPTTGFCTLTDAGGGTDAAIDGDGAGSDGDGSTGGSRAPDGADGSLEVAATVDGGDAADAAQFNGAIFISSPVGTTYTNKALIIQAAFPLGSSVPQAVEFVNVGAGGSPIGAMTTAPFSFTWDTTQVAEGPYQISARATFGGLVATSVPITIIVDRTPPTIRTRAPVAGASDVDLSDPITVEVSEPLAAATVSPSAVTLADSSSQIPITVMLNADGKTLTVSLTNRRAMALPATLSETVSPTLTDLAGNPLVIGAPWTWTAPLWRKLGVLPGERPSLVLDSKAHPMVCTIVERGAIGSHDYQLLVGHHQAATTWDTSFGTPQGAQGSSFVPGPAAVTAAADDNPIVAWPEFQGANSGTPATVHVAQWTGLAWDKSFGEVDAVQGNNTGASAPTLTMLTSGQFVLAWTEASPTYVSSAYAARWTGTSWDFSYGGIGKVGAGQHVLRVSGGLPILAWATGISGAGVSTWTGTAWTSQTFANSGGVGFDVDKMQRPVVTSIASGTNQISVIRYDAQTAGWSPTGPALSTSGSPLSPVLAIDPIGQVLVAWTESDGTAYNLRVARFDGAAWDYTFGTLSAVDGPNTDARLPAMVLTSDGTPILAWDEPPDASGSRPSTYVWKSNH